MATTNRSNGEHPALVEASHLEMDRLLARMDGE
jgi:hypothetical protein